MTFDRFEYNRRPEVMTRVRERRRRPEAIAQLKEYRRRPEIKTRRNELRRRRRKEDLEFRDKEREINRLRGLTEERQRYSMFRSMKHRAEQRGLVCDITFFDLKSLFPEDSQCFYCRETMKRKTKTTPSVDRILPNFGYIKGNIQIICALCNTKKQNATAVQHEAFAKHQRKTEKLLRNKHEPIHV